MDLHPKQLTAFQAVMRTGGMTAAAAFLGVSQPAVSRLISDLEESVGFRLFERLNNRILPTAEAELFREQVERWSLGLESVSHAAERIRGAGLGHIAMTAVSGISVGVLNQVIAGFLRERPDVTFSLEVASTDNALRLVSSYDADVGIVQWRPGLQAVNLIRLPPFEAVCVMPSGHRLSGKAEVQVSDLEGEEIISMQSGSPLRVRTDAAILAAGVHVRRRIDSSVSASICELVALGFGIAIVNPLSLAHLAHDRLIARPFRPSLPYEICIALPRHRTRSRLLDEFVERLQIDFRQRSTAR